MSRRSSRSSISLEVPSKGIAVMDDGARDLQSSDGEEYFSDASEGRKKISRPATPTSPIPRTRIEKVDDKPSHGEVPGTPAYHKRLGDAVPDEVEILTEGRRSRSSSRNNLDVPTTPGGTRIPRTIVQKVDPSSPSHGEVPGTAAYNMRAMDATPDLILKVPTPGKKTDISSSPPRGRPVFNLPIPETIVTRVDDEPAYGEEVGTEAYNKRKLDAAPDIYEVKPDSSGHRFLTQPEKSRAGDESDNDNNESNELNDNAFGDDFDDFEEGAQAGAEDDFGEFGDGFQESTLAPEPAGSMSNSLMLDYESRAVYPLIDFDDVTSPSEILEATEKHLDAMFPHTTREYLSSFTTPSPISETSPIFPSDRSRSLWKQLVTPPPLQPPNWTQSRIRRLFLVSLGVPVDLDEILPPSKVKKLVLPDLNLESSSQLGGAEKPVGSVARLKAQAGNDSSASVDSSQSATKSSIAARNRKSKGPPPPPELDLVAVKRLCATTDERLDGFTDQELQAHVKELEAMTQRTAVVLDYWLQRRDGSRKEKEAFEGVIENLVRHARRVRK